jgi:hypothetical protein
MEMIVDETTLSTEGPTPAFDKVASSEHSTGTATLTAPHSATGQCPT